ncbi:hypothetical protein, conserved [Plasmodium gonderi]|uniref:Uncharacterized protein n=1 Tax=Plasmodium gonderi TaxID=77519 RepID=A0A1Y1JC54_PLAGO|nr:hypothetical protein, conserved [Plasmodium gonderi]GAW78945.1 hypothetical protein, conserved [Plasmodium gonderi]
MISFDEIFEFLREAEITCDNFNEQREEQEKIILFLNELKSYIADFSISLKQNVNSYEDVTEIDILKKIITKKESLEHVIRKEIDNYVPTNILKNNISISSAYFKEYYTFPDPINTNLRSISEEQSLNEISPGLNVVKSISRVKGDILNQSKDINLDVTSNLPSNLNSECGIILTIPPLVEEKETTEGSKTEISRRIQINVQAEEVVHTNQEKTKNEKITTQSSGKEEIYDGIEILKEEVLKEWSEQIDEYDNLLYEYSFAYKKKDLEKKIETRKSMNKSGDENVDEELCLLAQEMKENVLTYREIIVQDNQMLEQSAHKQLTNLDNISHVHKNLKQMGKSQNISFFMSLIIIVVSVLLFMFTFFIILIL